MQPLAHGTELLRLGDGGGGGAAAAYGMIPFSSSQQPPHTPTTTATPGWRERGGDRAAAELDLGSMMMMKGPVSAINKTMALTLLEQQGIHHGRGGPVLRTPRGGAGIIINARI